MRDTNQELEMGAFDERRLEIENRIKNLFWTVSGDYSLNVRPDIEAFARSKYIALYDAIKQGAFAKYFDVEQLGLYIIKKVSRHAQEKPLLELTQLCVDAAVYPMIRQARLGIDEIRRRAFTDILKHQEARVGQTLFGKVKCTIIKRFLGKPDPGSEAVIRQAADAVLSLENATDTQAVIQTIDDIYNTFFDTAFESEHGDLQQILALPTLEIANAAWQDCLSDEQMEDIIKVYLSNVSEDAMRLDIEDKPKTWRPDGPKEKSRLLENTEEDEEAIKKVQEYVELNYGKTYLSKVEYHQKNARLCKGIHRGCTLHFTEGVLHDPVKKNNQYRFIQLQFEKNRMYYGKNHWIIKRNVAILADALKKALVMRQEEEVCRASSGQLVPSRLWKRKRTTDEKLFDKKLKSQNSEFVVDILLDSSGSQSGRQSQVAAQGYIISEALSQVGIPHRVTGYCTFWDYTVMNRFRDYDDEKEMDSRIFEFRASANNRDGLALKAVSDSLQQRPEDFKILIVLSDGKPNDAEINRPGTRKRTPYQGEEAVKDTAFEVRRARAAGISVMGIFAGSDEDLSAEKRIYGKDFAYIRNISNFSNIVGAYLRRQLDKD